LAAARRTGPPASPRPPPRAGCLTACLARRRRAYALLVTVLAPAGAASCLHMLQQSTAATRIPCRIAAAWATRAAVGALRNTAQLAVLLQKPAGE
jgi:hypothetical protein